MAPLKSHPRTRATTIGGRAASPHLLEEPVREDHAEHRRRDDEEGTHQIREYVLGHAAGRGGDGGAERARVCARRRERIPPRPPRGLCASQLRTCQNRLKWTHVPVSNAVVLIPRPGTKRASPSANRPTSRDLAPGPSPPPHPRDGSGHPLLGRARAHAAPGAPPGIARRGRRRRALADFTRALPPAPPPRKRMHPRVADPCSPPRPPTQLEDAKVETARDDDKARLKALSDARAGQWPNTLEVRTPRVPPPPSPPAPPRSNSGPSRRERFPESGRDPRFRAGTPSPSSRAAFARSTRGGSRSNVPLPSDAPPFSPSPLLNPSFPPPPPPGRSPH